MDNTEVCLKQSISSSNDSGHDHYSCFHKWVLKIHSIIAFLFCMKFGKSVAIDIFLKTHKDCVLNSTNVFYNVNQLYTWLRYLIKIRYFYFSFWCDVNFASEFKLR